MARLSDMKKILIKNGRVIDPESDFDQIADILIESGSVKKIGTIEKESDMKIVDASGLLIIPGIIDLHVHLRDMEQAEKETVESASMSAMAGGITTVFAMPNTRPTLSSSDTILLYSQLLSKIPIRSHIIGAITKNLEGKELAALEQYSSFGIRFISDDGMDVNNEALLEEAYRMAQKNDLTLITHPEMSTVGEGGVINEGLISQKLGLPGQPNAKEFMAIERGLKLALKTGARAHFTHISTRESVKMIREAKKKSSLITCDATPHHFSLTEEEVLRVGTLAKVNPPLRTEIDRQAIIEGLKDGTIDLIATDHAPHTDADKPDDFLKAAFGISQLETSLASTLTELHFQQKMPLMKVIRLMTLNPAQLTGLEVGRIQEGHPADLVLVDLNKEKIVDRMSFFSKGKNTPFQGKILKGWPFKTMINGRFLN